MQELKTRFQIGDVVEVFGQTATITNYFLNENETLVYKVRFQDNRTDVYASKDLSTKNISVGDLVWKTNYFGDKVQGLVVLAHPDDLFTVLWSYPKDYGYYGTLHRRNLSK